MSEKLNRSHEQQPVHETTHSHELANDKLEAAKRARHEHAEALDEIRHNIDKQAIETEKTRAETVEDEPTEHQHVTKELKAIRYKETMRYVRRHLTKRERKFSNFVHTPTVEKISEVGAKTVARPSGLLGGGLVALVGSITVLYIARQYGFEVPNSLFMALFIVGFVVGLVGEFIITGFSLRRGNRYKKHGYRR
jgi:hypothetical protein